jgi:hypothetical protein
MKTVIRGIADCNSGGKMNYGAFWNSSKLKKVCLCVGVVVVKKEEGERLEAAGEDI